MSILPMPADWCAEHTRDAAFKRAIIDAFRVPTHLWYPNAPSMIVIVDPGMPAGSMSLVNDAGETVRLHNSSIGGA